MTTEPTTSRRSGAYGEVAARSRAFREALLKSQERRAYAVIVLLLVIAVPLSGLRFSSPTEVYLKVVGAIAGLLLLVVQVWSIGALRWARRHDRLIPGWVDALSVAVECSVPTGVILAHILLGAVAPYVAVSSPPILAYGLLITLTTLRLRPGLCLLGGAVAACGYAGVLAYVWVAKGSESPAPGWPRPGYAMALLLLLSNGAVAAWVARQIRSHVEAALDEAETRRKMERVERDLLVARTIQQSLLPRSRPSVPGFDIAAWNRPADQTGGDYYDWQLLPDGNWIVTLADVSGHGIGPALVTAACRAYVRASSAHHADLMSLATRVNRLLAEDLPDGRFITMVNVLIDGSGGSLALLSAGHGPIVLYVKATGGVESIGSQALPLAVTPELETDPPRRLELKPGDVLALVTDGIVEWAREGGAGAVREEFGLDRLHVSLSRHAHLPAAELIEAVVRDVGAFAGGTAQQDDLTLVVLKAV